MNDQILTAKKVNQPAPDQSRGLAGPQADTRTLEAEILVLSAVETDRLAYELYGLTEEEIKIVEESVA